MTAPALTTPCRWFRISPRRIQAWREVNDVPDRELMRDGRWLVWRLGRARRMAAAQRLHGPKPRRTRGMLEAGQIEPGDADGDREGGPA